ncbi:hypothetical protein Kpol_455p10 [Vanderwaltozyma polyspora DSM 70294]|uniref:Zn(2)-C6 fungal-type domain-containing protein n=1 Tax=Vanderwaltozyma polyspora (strain ATCC 22028 / DSM 70294 / BCRC 21397 / CBS 2163 / NBRC 10782 / NRRL Y-8283 / UCD 57-17) TaxID=436907 RepID=A7TR31_VANPO|nr:uncharacterized protein Kpol_455p10 [Vanderwaltozyma polyspora DSM 70294]EDO15279.1 hypothetical protein Kpol_455p10 [Vanderwaltozyma polyspora DSM 70294]
MTSKIERSQAKNNKNSYKRIKTFTGCWTCRSRKIKCDLTKPSCRKCTNSRIECGGYDIKLVWTEPVDFNTPEVSSTSREESVSSNISGSASNSTPSNKFTLINNNINNTSTQSNETQKRRNITLVKYKNSKSYTYYEEMDEELISLQNPKKDKIDNGQTYIIKNFGVFKAHHSDESTPKTTATPSNSEINSNQDTVVSQSFYDVNENMNNWISNELKDDFMLSLSALQGLPVSSHSFDDLVNDLDVQDSYRSLFHNPTNDELIDSNLKSIKYQYHGNENLINPDHNLTETGNLINTLESPTSLNNMVSYKEEINLDPLENDMKMPNFIMEVVPSRLPELVSSSDPLTDFPNSALKINSLTRFLLNYYYENVADLMTVIPISANPWKKMYFPTVLRALGDLCGIGHTSNSKKSLLNAILAVSCFNLQSKFPKNSNEMIFYLNLGINFRNQASNYLKECLENTVNLEKYKDIVVALLSMNSIDVVWGTMADCRYHLTVCEDFIESRLKLRPILSNKAKILHSIFAFLKLIQDSTSLDKVREKEICIYFDNSKANDNNQDGTIRKFFETMDNFEGKLQNEKGYFQYDKYFNSENEDFNHAIVPSFKSQLYDSMNTTSSEHLNPKLLTSEIIYGLPNSLILLFSDCVSLIRHLEYFKLNNIKLSEEFLNYCNRFEIRLLNWKSDWNEESILKFKKINIDRYYSLKALNLHTESFYNSTIIYYFTMVRSFNISSLQQYVEDVLHGLKEINTLIEQNNVKIVPLIWQGFMAGCACTNTTLQGEFRTWASKLANTGMGSYWGARQAMLEVWRRRKHGEEGDSWYSVYKDWDMNLMLS